jgi:hypothetical protein
MCVLVMVFATGAFTSCKEDTSGGEDPPVTVDDIVSVDATGTASLQLLTNDTNLTHEPLTVTIDDSPTVGSATVNSDNTVRLDLPSDFRGVTRFKYKLTNSVGGFSVSTAVVYVEVPAYRVLFAASSATQPAELYVSDFISATKLSSATSGNLRLTNAWHSEGGGLVVYERADPTQVTSSPEMFYVRTTPVGSPTRITQPSGRNFVDTAPVVISPDDQWIAFNTAPASSSGRGADLYVLDTSNASSPTAVGLSENVNPALTQWLSGGNLYFMSAPGNGNSRSIYRASSGSFDSPQRVSPLYPTADTNTRLDVSPDQTKILLGGSHNNQVGIFFIDPNDPTTERRLTTDIPAGAVLEPSYQISEDFTQVTYLWRMNGSSVARLSRVDIADSGTPRVVLETEINALNELSPDGQFALVTRGPGGSASDGTLFEVSLDRSTADVRIASNVSGGYYDDTNNRVFLFSRTLAPSVIARGDFDRAPSPLVRSNTSPGSLYVTPDKVRSTAIIEDTTAGLVQVNAASPGNTIRLTTLNLAQVGGSLLPTVILPAP